MLNYIKNNKEQIAHSYWYMGIIAAFCLLGWSINSIELSYTALAVFIILTPILTYDIKTILIFIPFCMTCFREFFYFSNIPFAMYIFIIAVLISIGIYVYRNIKENKNIKLRFNIMSISFSVLTAVSFLSTLVRNIFFNEPAFFTYETESGLSFLVQFKDAYNILYGYAFSFVLLLITLLSIAFSSFKNNLKYNLFEKIFYVFALYLALQYIIAFFATNPNLFKEFKITIYRPYNETFIGWADKNAFIISIEMCLPFLCGILRKTLKRIDVIAILCVFAVIVLISDSRGGQLTVALMAPLLLYIIMMDKKNKWIWYFSFIGAAIVAVVLAYFVVDPIRISLNRIFDQGLYLTGRDKFWLSTLEYTFDDPAHMAFGPSPAYLFELYRDFHPDTTNVGVWLCHNTFVTAIAIGGVFGLITMIYHHIEVGFGIVKRAEDKDKLILLAFFAFGMVHGIIDNTLFSVLYLIPYVIIFSDYDKKFTELI
ncbi:MAG: O-antigen ligase family protein [Acholeplasmatales bacterium]|nr:O-antigen ligase family protein [Acholeplasmatales bacterium]